MRRFSDRIVAHNPMEDAWVIAPEGACAQDVYARLMGSRRFVDGKIVVDFFGGLKPSYTFFTDDTLEPLEWVLDPGYHFIFPSGAVWDAYWGWNSWWTGRGHLPLPYPYNCLVTDEEAGRWQPYRLPIPEHEAAYLLPPRGVDVPMKGKKPRAVRIPGIGYVFAISLPNHGIWDIYCGWRHKYGQ